MAPVLLHAFGFTLRSYPFMLSLGVVVAMAINVRLLRELPNVAQPRAWLALATITVIGLVGARAHWALTQWESFKENPLGALAFWNGGLHAPGGLIALTLGSFAVFRALGLPALRLSDRLSPTVGIALAFARLGCFLEGCCFGTTCTWPWCVSFPQGSYVRDFHVSLALIPSDASRSASVHPLQLYFLGAALLVAITTRWLKERARYEGEVTLVGLFLFSTTSAALEFLRADYYPRVYWGALPQLEWVTLAMSLVALSALAICAWRYSASTEHVRPPHRVRG